MFFKTFFLLLLSVQISFGQINISNSKAGKKIKANLDKAMVNTKRFKNINLLNMRQGDTTSIWVIMPGMVEPIKMPAEKMGNQFIVQGDIVLSNNQILDISPNATKRQAKGKYAVARQALSGKDNGQWLLSGDYIHLWEYGVIPYSINKNVSDELRDVINDAIKTINEECRGAIRLRPKVSKDEDYVAFIFDKDLAPGVGNSCIGRAGGRQFIRLSKEVIESTVIHEILHAAGAYHEHARTDRNNYINVEWTNVQWGKKHNFLRFGPFFLGRNYTSYDYASIMHYGKRTFGVKKKSGQRKQTIFPVGDYKGRIGGNKLSKRDIEGLVKMYSRDKWMVSLGGTSIWVPLNNSKVPLHKMATGDFDGNGTTDMFYANGSTWRIAFDGSQRWTKVNNSKIEVNQLLFGDFDGDGKTDVFYANGKKWQVSFGARSGWQTINKSKIRKNQLMLGHFDNDNKIDVFYANGKEWKFSSGGRSSWKMLNAKTTITKNKLVIGRFNADKLSDVLFMSGKKWKISTSGRHKFRVWNDSAITKDKIRAGDFNGDGKTDILYANGRNWRVSYSAIKSWEVLNRSKVRKIKTGDFDGDGKTDVIRAVE
jgi:hypothetical protein